MTLGEWAAVATIAAGLTATLSWLYRLECLIRKLRKERKHDD